MCVHINEIIQQYSNYQKDKKTKEIVGFILDFTITSKYRLINWIEL